MYQTNFDKRSLRSALLLGAASVAVVGLSMPARAQDQGEAAETVVVTGSRIPQQGLYSPSPVTAVGEQEMKFEGTTNIDNLLNNLPAVFAAQTTGVSNGATGAATVNLRNLGVTRTLVLVNGSRLMPGDPTQPVADLNDIPSALVDHVEVLTGAASAVYGSDAVAGVVNFIMRKDFEGVEVDAQYGTNEADNDDAHDRSLEAAFGAALPKEDIFQGATDTGTLIIGANTDNGKGNVTAYLGYENTEAVAAGNLDYGACTIVLSGGIHKCGGSSTFSRITSIDNADAKFASSGDSFFVNGTGAAGSGKFVPFLGTPSQEFNFGATNYQQRPDQRFNGGFFAHYEVNKELDVYSSFMFTDDNTIGQIAARGAFFGVGAISSTFFNTNCSNPYLVADPGEAAALCGSILPTTLNSKGQTLFSVYGTKGPLGNGYDCASVSAVGLCTGPNNSGSANVTPGQARLEIGRRALEGGPQDTEYRHTSFREQIGAKGDLGDGWTYDVYAQEGTSVWQSDQMGYFSTRNIASSQEATGTPSSPSCISGSPCVPLDVFDGIGSITPKMLGYEVVPAVRVGYTEEQILSGSITGDLGEYGMQSPWAKSPVAVSFGSEYRAETLEDTPDEEFQSADLNGGGGARAAVPRSGFSVTEGFGELKAPLIQERPFFEDLSLNAGYRYSSYSLQGSVSAYKYGAEWQPIDDIRFRASYERAVRAPNVLELFSPAVVGLFSAGAANDPCATSTAGQCAGVPNAGNSALLTCPSNQCNQQTGGNISLKPEIGNTRTVGAILTPTFIDGFTATIDYYDIDVSHAIGTVSPTTTLANCYSPTASAGAIAFFCPLVHRSAIGAIFGSGFVQATNINTGFKHTEGLDFEANYNFSFDDMKMTQGWGALQFAFIGTWLQTLTIEPLPGLGQYDCAGLFGATCSGTSGLTAPNPRWRHRLRVTWATPWDLDLSANWRYMSGVSLDADSDQPLLNPSLKVGDIPDQRINDYWYLDVAADWNIRTGIDLHAGVNNVFDRDPPVLSSGAIPVGTGNNNTFPGTYDPLGRTIFVGATIKY